MLPDAFPSAQNPGASGARPRSPMYQVNAILLRRSYTLLISFFFVTQLSHTTGGRFLVNYSDDASVLSGPHVTTWPPPIVVKAHSHSQSTLNKVGDISPVVHESYIRTQETIQSTGPSGPEADTVPSTSDPPRLRSLSLSSSKVPTISPKALQDKVLASSSSSGPSNSSASFTKEEQVIAMRVTQPPHLIFL
jgi:hypothetical protein